MIAQDQINRGGSKLEITRALLQAGLDREIPIPRSCLRYSGEPLQGIYDEFHRMRKPVVVRGSHRNDYHGYVDIIPTFRDVYTFPELEDCVKRIESVAACQETKAHCLDWKQEFTPEVHILVQEKGSDIIGSTLRHPNLREIMYLQYDTVQNRQKTDGNPVSSAEFHGNQCFDPQCYLKEDEVEETELKRVFEMCTNLESSGILDPTWSYQFEFGLKPLLFYQARPFKRFQVPAEFDIPENLHALKTGYVFGITPKDGVVLPYADMTKQGYFYNWSTADWTKEDFNAQESLKQFIQNPYALCLRDKLRSSIFRGRNIGEIKVFGSACNQGNFLFHENYRLMKKSQLTLLLSEGTDKKYKKVRVFSNGREGCIIPE